MAVSERQPSQFASEPSGLAMRARSIILSKEGILFLIMIVAVIILSLLTDKFLTTNNLLNQLRLVVEIGLMALPMTFIIITGGIDLSVGSIFGLSAIVMGFLWQDSGWPLEGAIVMCLVVGLVCGFINGFFIVRVGVPPLIMTLATLALYRGVALGVSEARSARGFPQWFFQLGQGQFLGIPTQLWLLLIGAIIAGIVLARTPFGRSIYAIGNNELGARFSGIPVNVYKLAIYSFSGFMAGLAGYVFTSRISTTRADMGTGIELEVIAAVVLGGTSINGGSGSILGTMIGLVLIQLLKNGLLLGGVKGDATIVIIGFIVIAAVLLNNFIQRRTGAA
jgi:rhamnose transport system permease protein